MTVTDQRPRKLNKVRQPVIWLAYDGYGNALNFDPATALTVFLYSGEQFDQRLAMQYLRARYYDMATGRFNRLDPFAGNMRDPQSVHKYLYTHADPVNVTDPSGLSILGTDVQPVDRFRIAFLRR